MVKTNLCSVPACNGCFNKFCGFWRLWSEQDDEVDRLSILLDDEGDGRVSYRSLLKLVVKHLGDWAKRLPEVRKGHHGIAFDLLMVRHAYGRTSSALEEKAGAPSVAMPVQHYFTLPLFSVAYNLKLTVIGVQKTNSHYSGIKYTLTVFSVFNMLEIMYPCLCSLPKQ